MPYLSEQEKAVIDGGGTPGNAGELNYLLTQVVNEYVLLNGLRYQTLNDVVGALDGAKAEFQRRVVAPYEDIKCAENGDVFPVQLLPQGRDALGGAHIVSFGDLEVSDVPRMGTFTVTDSEPKYDGAGNVVTRFNEAGDKQVWVRLQGGGYGHWETVER